MSETENDETHHDRRATRAADTWDEEPMDEETALSLRDKLEERGYDVRLCVEAKHEDSSVIKTVDNQDDADVTLAEIRLEEEYPKDG